MIPLFLCSEHAIRRDRPTVVLGSEVGALGRYERVPLGEESDRYKKETHHQSVNLRLPCPMQLSGGDGV